MIIEQAIQKKLRSLSAVTAITGQRIYVGTLPQSVIYPAVSIIQVSAGVSYTHRYDRPRLQLTITAETYPDAKSASDEIINALNSFEGIVEGLTVGSIAVDGQQFLRDEKRYIFILDVFVRYINK
jgi:hypothetical protein